MTKLAALIVLTAALALAAVWPGTACRAAGGDADMPGALEGYSIEGPEDEAAREDLELERRALTEFYNQKMLTVSGQIAALDHAAGTLTLATDEGGMVFSFDAGTHFQVGLGPVGPAALKPGQRAAVLYRELPDGGLYLGRVVVMKAGGGRRRRR